MRLNSFIGSAREILTGASDGNVARDRSYPPSQILTSLQAATTGEKCISDPVGDGRVVLKIAKTFQPEQNRARLSDIESNQQIGKVG